MAAPHGDPRAWTREQVNQWIARQGGPRMDHGLDGPELCRMGTRSWFRSKFPGVGQKLCDDLRERRKVIEKERMFGDKRTADKRVVEGTRAAFLVMAFQICMIFYLLGQQLEKASKVLNHLYQLVDVVKRRAADKNKVDPCLFGEWRMENSIRDRTALDSTQVSLVLGSKCIAVADETYNKVVTALSEAMEVIGAPLEIKIKMAFWKKAVFFVGTAAAIGMTAGGAAAVFGASMGASALIGGAAALTTVTALAIADNAGNVHLIAAYEVFMEKEQRTVEFTSNYLRAVLLTTKIVDRSNMSESELGDIIRSVEQEGHDSVIQTVEEMLMRKIRNISRLQNRLSENLMDIHVYAGFEYRATAWLKDDSVKDVNDSINIALLQFGMRDLVRDVFILGVIGPEGNSKKKLLKSVFPNAADKLEQNSCDIVLCDGSESTSQTVPVLLFPSGENAATKATLGLWTRTCSAFICVQDYTSVTPDLQALKAVAGLCVPVLMCINTKGEVMTQGEADRAIERYKSCLSYDLRDLVQVVLVDLSDWPTSLSSWIPDRYTWIARGGDVKYWVQDALDHHQGHACNIDKDFKDSL